jgi:hypothetical protein
MESFLSNFDIDNPKNFWKLYPSWKTPKVLRDFYNNDKTKDKSKSSLLIWAIVHMFDRSESNPYKDMDSVEKLEVINDDVLNNSSFDWTEYKELIDAVGKLYETEEERNLRVFISYIEARRKFLDKEQGNLTFDTIKQFDETVKRNKENMAELQRLKDLVEQNTDKGRTRGNIEESAMEKGLI